MNSYSGKHVVVFGRDPSGEAAADLLGRHGASVRLEPATEDRPAGMTKPDLVVISAGCATTPRAATELAALGVPVVGERELAFRESLCLHVAVAGASGKSTTSGLIAHILRSTGRRVEIACGLDQPASRWVEESRSLDLMIHGIEAGELEHLHFFRPVVAVLLNAPTDHPDTEGAGVEYVRRLARLFAKQQAFDWTIVQSETLAQLVANEIVPPGKVITFSASSRQADLGVDRGLLVSRLEGWAGPLWDMARGRLRGPHFAEDVLAALAVGRVLRLSADEMTHALDGYAPGPGRFEFLGETDGVRFVDDGRSSNLDSLAKALLTLAPILPETPFIWLIAGGATGGRQFYDVGPILSPRVKQALVYGEAAAAMRNAWGLFTPCSLMDSLLDAAKSAIRQAVSGDTVLFSPACPRTAEGVQQPPDREAFRRAVGVRLKLPLEREPGSDLAMEPGNARATGSGVVARSSPATRHE